VRVIPEGLQVTWQREKQLPASPIPVETILSVSMRRRGEAEGQAVSDSTEPRLHPSRQGQAISGGPDSLPITSGSEIFPSLSADNKRLGPKHGLELPLSFHAQLANNYLRNSLNNQSFDYFAPSSNLS
jgi:hypothetical protein